MRRPPGLLLLALVISFALAPGCDSGTDADPTPTSVPALQIIEAAGDDGSYAVGVTTLNLVDTSRPTEANGEYSGAPERQLPTEVWYPAQASRNVEETRDAPVDATGDPYPLIVFAHGLSGVRTQSSSYTRHLAAHGYIVASPDFPLSHLGSPGGTRLAAVVEQPADISFIIDSMLARSGDDEYMFANAIDANAIGMTGHSLGGLTTLLSVFGPLREERIDAALPLSPPACFLSDAVVGETKLPLMVLGGSQDLIVNPASIRQAYDHARAPRIYGELVGGNHLGFADASFEDSQIVDLIPRLAGGDIIRDATLIANRIGGGLGTCTEREDHATDPKMTVERQHDLERILGTLFFDAFLRGDSDAKTALASEELTSALSDVRFERELP